MNNTAPQSMRIDKWLWAARFYKTRTLAAEAVNGGHVHINGSRGKPSRLVKAGDEIHITKGVSVFTLEVIGLSNQRGPAQTARNLYSEHEASVKQREAQAAMRRQAAASTGPKKRPDKRARRQIVRFINKHQQTGS